MRMIFAPMLMFLLGVTYAEGHSVYTNRGAQVKLNVGVQVNSCYYVAATDLVVGHGEAHVLAEAMFAAAMLAAAMLAAAMLASCSTTTSSMTGGCAMPRAVWRCSRQ